MSGNPQESSGSAVYQQEGGWGCQGSPRGHGRSIPAPGTHPRRLMKGQPGVRQTPFADGHASDLLFSPLVRRPPPPASLPRLGPEGVTRVLHRAPRGTTVPPEPPPRSRARLRRDGGIFKRPLLGGVGAGVATGWRENRAALSLRVGRLLAPRAALLFGPALGSAASASSHSFSSFLLLLLLPLAIFLSFFLLFFLSVSFIFLFIYFLFFFFYFLLSPPPSFLLPLSSFPSSSSSFSSSFFSSSSCHLHTLQRRST